MKSLYVKLLSNKEPRHITVSGKNFKGFCEKMEYMHNNWYSKSSILLIKTANRLSELKVVHEIDNQHQEKLNEYYCVLMCINAVKYIPSK